MFIKCSDGSGYNPIIDLDRIAVFEKGRELPGQQIMFLIDGVNVTWGYASEESRDKDYQLLMDILKPKTLEEVKNRKNNLKEFSKLLKEERENQNKQEEELASKRYE